jgi:acyl-CoA thioesterase YciA
MSEAEEQLPKDEQPAIRIFAMPTDTNASGDIFGGWLMSQVDIAGSIAAYRRAKGRIVTVAVNEFVFLKPVYVGDLVSIYSEVTKVGNTSLQVAVTSYTQRERGSGTCQKVSEALLTYVAIDENRKPRPIDH